RVVVDRPVAGPLAERRREGAEVDEGDLGRKECRHPLDGPAVDDREGRPPGGVAADHRVERGDEEREVEVAGDVAARVDVPGDEIWVLLMEPPESLLVEGERPVAEAERAGDGGHRRRRAPRRRALPGAERLEEGPLLRREGGEAIGNGHPALRLRE